MGATSSGPGPAPVRPPEVRVRRGGPLRSRASPIPEFPRGPPAAPLTLPPVP